MDISDSSSSSSEDNDMTREDGWEDIEPDDEPISFTSLFDEQVFSNILHMLHHCKEKYQFDIWDVKRKFGRSIWPRGVPQSQKIEY